MTDWDLLLTDAEREIFLALREDYQRDNFIRRFWKVRDPFLTTARNEFRDLWQERVAAARKEINAVVSRLKKGGVNQPVLDELQAFAKSL